VFSIFIFFSSNTHAAQVTLAWDSSNGADGYRLFYRQDGQSYNYSSPAWEGAGTICTIDLDSEATYYLAIRAYNAYGESGDSNEASITIGSPVITPDLDYIEIEGPPNVSENSTAGYNCRAYYTDGTSLLVEPDAWDVDCTYAGISATGLLTTYDVDSDQACQIAASYTEGGITSADTHDATIRDSITPPPDNLDYIEIEGAPNVSENFTADYNCRAYYTDGTNRLVEPDTWDVDCFYASISATGLLTTYDVDSDQACQITANYLEGGITESDTYDTTIIDSNGNDPPLPDQLVSNVVVSNSKAYQVMPYGLQVGARVYIDRTYYFTLVPGYLAGETYIQTANRDKESTGSDFLSFDVNQDVTVYVAHDARIENKPAWLLSFTDTGDGLVNTDTTTLRIYARDFPAGTVTLGGNEGSWYSMYVVIVSSNDQ